jgi:signal transduction histidine kinase
MRFRSKIMLGVAVIVMALLAVMIGSALSVLRDSNEAELTRRVQLAGKLLAVAAKDAVIAQDLATLDSLVTEAMASDQIAFVRIVDAAGVVLAQQGDATLLGRPFHSENSLDDVHDGVFDASTPVLAGALRQGEVQLGVSTAPLTILLASARHWAASMAGLVMVLVALFSWLLGSYLTRQLVALRRASQRFAAGDFEYRVPVKGHDDLAQTAMAFNSMAQQLGDSREVVRAESLKRLAAQQAAEKSDQLLREAVSSISQGITLYDEADRLMLCNEAYLKFYETSRDLIVPGNTFEDIVRRGAERGQYREAVGRVDDWVRQRVAQHQRADGSVLEQPLADGRWLMIVEHRTPSGYIVGNRIDITARRAAEARVREHAAQLNGIFALSPDAFISFDRAHCVKYVSPAFSRLLGIAAFEVMGLGEVEFSQRLAQVCVPQARFPGIAALRVMNQNGAATASAPGAGREQRHKIELADASKRVLEVGLRESPGESVTQILYLHDISRETEVDLMKSEFLSTAAHELRTPMASIFGFSEVLLHQELDEASRTEFLTIIHKQAELMSTILNELLDLARIEARRGKDFVFKDLPVPALVTEVVHGFKLPAGRLPPRMTFPGGPVSILADQKKVQQAILNVLSNAYKYSPAGGEVSITVESHAPWVAIRISDPGIGLSPEQRQRVGERFYRADASGKVPGTGLGVSIVKEIVDIHRGQVEIDSQLGQGTTVTLLLPVAPEAPLPQVG